MELWKAEKHEMTETRVTVMAVARLELWNPGTVELGATQALDL